MQISPARVLTFSLSSSLVTLGLLTFAPTVQAQGPSEETSFTYSSSREMATPAEALIKPVPNESVSRPTNRTLHSMAFAAKIGANGVGFDVATPLTSFLSLRSGAQFFSHDLNPNANGLHSVGQLTLQNVQTSIDIFPFRHSSFHLSPGVTVHNDNHLSSSLFVPGGSFFTLGDTSYMSDPSNPINGHSLMKLGNPIAPRFTLGWGSMLPRGGGHFSVPFEIGVQYISSPTLDLQLHGSACDGMGNCGDINASDGPLNIQSEIQQLNQDISTLRFFPIMSIGISYKFGH